MSKFHPTEKKFEDHKTGSIILKAVSARLVQEAKLGNTNDDRNVEASGDTEYNGYCDLI